MASALTLSRPREDHEERCVSGRNFCKGHLGPYCVSSGLRPTYFKCRRVTAFLAVGSRCLNYRWARWANGGCVDALELVQRRCRSHRRTRTECVSVLHILLGVNSDGEDRSERSYGLQPADV